MIGAIAGGIIGSVYDDPPRVVQTRKPALNQALAAKLPVEGSMDA